MKFKFKSMIVAASLIALSACGSDDDATTSTIGADLAASPAGSSPPAGSAGTPVTPSNAVDVAKSQPNLSILVEAVVAAGLTDTIANGGPFTVLAPTNDAFVALLDELGVTKDALFADTALLTEVLTYHVVSGTVKKGDVQPGKAVEPLSGDVFSINASADGALTVADGRGRTANIIATDVMADNAVIHVIDRVILPADKTVVEQAQANADFSILVEAVVAAGLVDTLSGAGPFTVFAPTNQAFVDLLAELGVSKEGLLGNTELLTQVLTYHVLPARVLKAEVPLNTGIATVQGGSLQVDSALAITDERGRQSRIVSTDVLATNGVVHAIDKVILPAAIQMPAPEPAPAMQTIVDLATADPQFSVLVEAVVAAGLVDTLSGPGPFTVFAPTNEAFAALLHELHLSKEALLADQALLTQVLTYHVLGGKILKADVPLDTPIATVQGGAFTIDSGFRVTDARHRQSNIVATDIAADNGVIHVIDRVLLP